jgi:hypothetical protein
MRMLRNDALRAMGGVHTTSQREPRGAVAFRDTAMPATAGGVSTIGGEGHEFRRVLGLRHGAQTKVVGFAWECRCRIDGVMSRQPQYNYQLDA